MVRTQMSKVPTWCFVAEVLHVAAMISGKDNLVRKVEINAAGIPEEASSPEQRGAVGALSANEIIGGSDNLVRKVTIIAAGIPDEAFRSEQDGTLRVASVNDVIVGGDNMVRKVAINADGVPEEALSSEQDFTMKASSAIDVLGGSDNMVRKVPINTFDVPDNITVSAVGVPEEALTREHDSTMRAMSVEEVMGSSGNTVRKAVIKASAVPEKAFEGERDGTLPAMSVDGVVVGSDNLVRKVAVNAAGVQDEVLTPEHDDLTRAMSVNVAGDVEDISSEMTYEGDLVRKAAVNTAFTWKHSTKIGLTGLIVEDDNVQKNPIDQQQSVKVAAVGLMAEESGVQTKQPMHQMPQRLSMKMNFTRMRSELLTELLSLLRSRDSRPWLKAYIPSVMSHSRFSEISIVDRFTISYFWILVLLSTLACSVSAIFVFSAHRNELTRQTFPETMQGVVRRLSDLGFVENVHDSDNESETWEGEGHDWEGFLWKLNHGTGPDERPNWMNWRARFFFVKGGSVIVDDIVLMGVYVEFISEKGNMSSVRHWITKRRPAIVKSLAPIQMAALSSTQKQHVLLKQGQYMTAIDTKLDPMSDLPTRLYPLCIKFPETNTDLTIASSSRQVIRDLTRRLESYSSDLDVKPC